MAFTLADSARSLDRQTADWDEQVDAGTVTLAGLDYVCSVTVGSIRPEWDEKTMTMRTAQTASVRIRRALLADCPSPTTRVVLRGLEWFIDSLGAQAADEQVWALGLKRFVTKAAT